MTSESVSEDIADLELIDAHAGVVSSAVLIFVFGTRHWTPAEVSIALCASPHAVDRRYGWCRPRSPKAGRRRCGTVRRRVARPSPRRDDSRRDRDSSDARLRHDRPTGSELGGFLGEEVGEHAGRDVRRWIADGFDGTRFFAAGRETWGTLLALEIDGRVVLGVCSSPVQGRRWWATRGHGAFTAQTDGSNATQLRVSARTIATPDRVACLPSMDALSPKRQEALEQLAGGRPVDHAWSHQNRTAEGEVDLCIWYGGAVWDHAAPSIIVEEAGGRFTDHWGGSRLDTRTAVYSNGIGHEQVLGVLRGMGDEP